MADFEEFEPLFDYKRVQPRRFVSIDDDDEVDSTLALSPKKRKVYKKDGNSKAVYILDEEEERKADEDEDKENEDWLIPPPPKLTCDPMALEESSTIRELRLKKQELLSFAQAAEDALKSMEESSKEEIGKSLESSLEEAKEDKPSKTEAESRAKIVLSFQAKDCLKQFRVYSDDKFERIFKMYAEKSKLDLKSLAFCFDGDKVGPEETPESLGMEDNEIIEVHVRSS